MNYNLFFKKSKKEQAEIDTGITMRCLDRYDQCIQNIIYKKYKVFDEKKQICDTHLTVCMKDKKTKVK